MTDQLLHDLLEERVAGVTSRDLSAEAWRTGRRTRRRERIAVVGCAALVTAVVGVGISLVGDRGGRTDPAPAPGTPTPTSNPTSTPEQSVPPPLSTEPDAAYRGVPVWWSPDEEQEDALPRVDSQLPAVIDLSQRVKAVDYAVAAFSVDEGRAVLLTGPQGGQMSVDISFLEDVTKPNGYAYRPVHHSMLSPTGRYLVFPQDGSVQVYTVETGTWREIVTGDRTTRFVAWFADDSFVLPDAPGGLGDGLTVEGEPAGRLLVAPPDPGFDTGSAQTYGRTRTGPSGPVQSWGMGVDLPVREVGTYLSQPEFLVADVLGRIHVLAFMWSFDQGTGGRFKQCCPVVSWLTGDTVIYESRKSPRSVLVAWTVGTNQFGLVSRVDGTYDVASYARLSQDLEDPVTS